MEDTKTTPRPLEAQLTTAVGLLVQFETQIAEYERHMASNRATKRAALRDRTFDATILGRIGGLRQGREKWAATVAELRAAIAERDAAAEAVPDAD